MQCTLTVYQSKEGPVIGEFVCDVQEPVHRVKQKVLERYGDPELTVQEVLLEVEQRDPCSWRNPGFLPLFGYERPIADLWCDVCFTHPVPSSEMFSKTSLLRRLHRETAACEREFLIYVRVIVPSPLLTSYYHSTHYVTGSMSLSSLKNTIFIDSDLTGVLEEGSYSAVLYDFRDCRVLDDSCSLEENGITPGSVLGLELRRFPYPKLPQLFHAITRRHTMKGPAGAFQVPVMEEGPAEAFPVTVVKEGTQEDVTVYVRPEESLRYVEQRLWLLGHLTSSTNTGQELGFFSVTAYEWSDEDKTVRELNIRPGTRLQLQWQPLQITGPLIASIILKSDILPPSVLDTKSAGKDPVSGPSQPSSDDKDPFLVPSQPSSEMDRPLKYSQKSILGKRERVAEVSDTVEQHFMDKYRTEIIERLSDIDYILDHMLAKLYISDEQYYRIRSVVVYQEKNRELYKVAQSWDDKAKQEFYDILKKEHPYFVASLEGQ